MPYFCTRLIHWKSSYSVAPLPFVIISHHTLEVYRRLNASSMDFYSRCRYIRSILRLAVDVERRSVTKNRREGALATGVAHSLRRVPYCSKTKYQQYYLRAVGTRTAVQLLVATGISRHFYFRKLHTHVEQITIIYSRS